MFTEDAMPKASLTLQCVMSLDIQYFAIYLCPEIVRTAKEIYDYAYMAEQKV